MKFDVDEIRECEDAFREFREYVREFCEEQEIGKFGMKSAMGVCEKTAENLLWGVEFKRLNQETIRRIIAYMEKKKAPRV